MLLALLRFLFQLMLAIACLFVVPVLVLACFPFMRQYDKANVLPAWLQWLNTWDDPGCDQGEYEPQVVWVHVHFGWWVKTWYWLGIRNQAYGLFYALAPQFRFYTPDCVYTKNSYWLTVVQDGRTWFNYVRAFTVGSKTVTVRFGWKLFSITQFLDGSDKTGHGSFDRPTLDCIIRIKSA